MEKIKSLTLIRLLGTLAAAVLGGQPASAGSGDFSAELKWVVDSVRMKLAQGRKTETDLAEQLNALDKLLATHRTEGTDEVAQALLMKALLYIQGLDQAEKGIALIRQLKIDFPDSTQGKAADTILDYVNQEVEAGKIRKSLTPGAKFPDIREKDFEGKEMSVAQDQGKVFLIHFWATWCGPSIREVASLIKLYEARHKDGFEIIGVSLDNDPDKLHKFLEAKGIKWRQYFDGNGWNNKLALKFGISSIPATYLLDREGTIIGGDLRGTALEEAVAEALEQK